MEMRCTQFFRRRKRALWASVRFLEDRWRKLAELSLESTISPGALTLFRFPADPMIRSGCRWCVSDLQSVSLVFILRCRQQRWRLEALERMRVSVADEIAKHTHSADSLELTISRAGEESRAGGWGVEEPSQVPYSILIWERLWTSRVKIWDRYLFILFIYCIGIGSKMKPYMYSVEEEGLISLVWIWERHVQIGPCWRSHRSSPS